MLSPASALESVWLCEAGRPWPMGADCVLQGGQEGVNFAVYSRHAERMELCLYDPLGVREVARYDLNASTGGLWHGFVAGLDAGQLYGYRAHGPYAPSRGQRFNPAKLLIDPFARSVVGNTQQLALEFDYPGDGPGATPDPTDNAARIPKSQVLNRAQELRAGAAIAPRPCTPWSRTVLYEAHVKGLTQCHPEVSDTLRGSYAGVVSPAMLAHYQRLGITTVCLLPVHLHLTEAHLLKKGLRNYWGYNTLGYFIPEPSYASGDYPDARTEFRHMVDQLHRHGLEVVLDVVFNHSAEGDTLGPTLSWRGLDNASWYALDDHGNYRNHSGCGNSLDLAQPCAVQLVMDSLRWWVQAFGVDGFRFDLATALGRDPVLNHDFHPASGLLAAMGQDPVLAGVKWIAEPWDLGPNGYQLGRFPAGWAEWNDRFRDSARAFWLGFDGPRGEFARRLTGSSDVFKARGRSPLSGINLITAHDGMTLADLTAYQHKHNAANQEGNRDGHNHNLSANGGVEGPTSIAPVLAQRGRWCRALLSTLLCAQGVPQLLAGDEFGQTQQGNNNAYCQDNPISWLQWQNADSAQVNFVAALIHLRQNHAALRHAQWFSGDEDIAWRNPDGSAMTDGDWMDPQQHSVICLIQAAHEGRASRERWLLVFNPSSQVLTCALPPGPWLPVLDSAAAQVHSAGQWALVSPCAGTITVPAQAVLGWVQP